MFKLHSEFISWLQNNIELLIKSEPIYFAHLVPSKLPVKGKGVYIIAHKDTHKVLYVGRTIDLRRRIYTNHLHGPVGTARLKKYLINDNDLPTIQCQKKAKEWIKLNCYCKFILIEESYERGILEGGLMGALSVKYVEKEH